MRLKTSRWFETVVRYERQSENADQKKVTETYVVECETFGDAEETITREMQTFVSGEFAVKNVTPAAFGEIFFSDNAEEGNWYKAKIAYIVVDETSGKEKKTNVNYLVQADKFNSAVKNIEAAMNGLLVDYQIVNITETKIMDVFERKAAYKNEQADDKPEYEAQK